MERPQKSNLPGYDKISQFKQKVFNGPYFIYIVITAVTVFYKVDQACVLKLVNTVFHREHFLLKHCHFMGKCMFAKYVINGLIITVQKLQ